MAPSALQHRRTHNLLLMSKLLDQRDAASPFTLVLDSLEQSGKPLVAELVDRAKSSNVRVLFVSFETLRKPRGAAVFVEAWKQSLQAWQKEVVAHLQADAAQRKLVVVDSLNALCATQSAHLPGLLSSLTGPATSLVALHHTDVPPPAREDSRHAYAPAPLTLLRYLATTVFTVHSLHHVLARKAARDRSRAEPSFGLEQRIEGVLQARGANAADALVVEMEHRRKSGRGVREWYVLPLPHARSRHATRPGTCPETICLLEDHLRHRSRRGANGADGADGADGENGANGGAGGADESQSRTTFELGLTDKQRRDREGVVLPYYDAQSGGGEGGRILYDMGEEDDFDEEEDEIL